MLKLRVIGQPNLVPVFQHLIDNFRRHPRLLGNPLYFIAARPVPPLLPIFIRHSQPDGPVTLPKPLPVRIRIGPRSSLEAHPIVRVVIEDKQNVKLAPPPVKTPPPETHTKSTEAGPAKGGRNIDGTGRNVDEATERTIMAAADDEAGVH